LNDITVILNPKAGQGTAAKLVGLLSQGFQRRNVRFHMALTSAPGHATELARSASGPVVVAVGGDGTINEVVNGLAGTEKHLGIIPAGSGNDFIKSVNIPANPSLALDRLFNERTMGVDIGTVQCYENWPSLTGDGTPASRCFINGVGVGFDAEVAAKTGEIPFLRGIPLYLLAVLKTLGPYRSPDFEIRIDDFRERARKLLIAVGNGRCAGGGFYLTPDAKVDDGELDVCLVEDIPIPRILRLMPRVMRGTHHGIQYVNFRRGKEITLTSRDRFYVHADGEIVGRKVQRVQIRMLEQKLCVIAG
jgi:diacylglycerol kinase (ATP)